MSASQWLTTFYSEIELWSDREPFSKSMSIYLWTSIYFSQCRLNDLSNQQKQNWTCGLIFQIVHGSFPEPATSCLTTMGPRKRVKEMKGQTLGAGVEVLLKVIDTNSHWHRPMIDISFWSVTFIYAHLILLVTQTQCPVNVQRLNHVHLSLTVLFLWWQETLLMFKPSPWMWTCWPMSRGHGSIWCSSLAGDEDHELN